MFAQFRTLLLLFVSAAINDYVVCEIFTIIPAESSTCPDSGICYTLNQYASTSSLSSGLDTITLELQPGTHTLEVPLVVSDISSFTLRGVDTTLVCEKRFNFTRLTENVILHGISFINCGGHGSIFENSVSDVRNFVIEDSIFQTDEPFYIQVTTNIQIINSTFTRSPKGVFYIFITRNMLIRNYTFLDNNIQASSSSIESGVVLVSGASSSVTIENTVFRNNHVSGERITAAFQGHGQQLTVVNSTFFSE